MDSIISRIIALAQPARPERFRRHLQTLDQRALKDRLEDLQQDAQKPHVPRWGRMQSRPKPIS